MDASILPLICTIEHRPSEGELSYYIGFSTPVHMMFAFSFEYG